MPANSSPQRKSFFDRVALWSPQSRFLLNAAVTVGSALLCAIALPARGPGIELLGASPSWLSIWVVSWSVGRTPFEGAIAGIALGLVQDGMTAPQPTHALSLAVVGLLTARLQKQRYIQEDFISVALIAFGMVVLAETILALQFWLAGDRPAADIWDYHQRVTLSSAILSSLWAPVVYYPLKRWWDQMNALDRVP